MLKPVGTATKTLLSSGNSGPANLVSLETVNTQVRLTAMSLTKFRAYLANLGRLANRDPAGEYIGSNLYVYANNNGVGNRDPLGLDCITKCNPRYHQRQPNTANPGYDCAPFALLDRKDNPRRPSKALGPRDDASGFGDQLSSRGKWGVWKSKQGDGIRNERGDIAQNFDSQNRPIHTGVAEKVNANGQIERIVSKLGKQKISYDDPVSLIEQYQQSSKTKDLHYEFYRPKGKFDFSNIPPAP